MLRVHTVGASISRLCGIVAQNPLPPAAYIPYQICWQTFSWCTVTVPRVQKHIGNSITGQANRVGLPMRNSTSLLASPGGLVRGAAAMRRDGDRRCFDVAEKTHKIRLFNAITHYAYTHIVYYLWINHNRYIYTLLQYRSTDDKVIACIEHNNTSQTYTHMTITICDGHSAAA